MAQYTKAQVTQLGLNLNAKVLGNEPHVLEFTRIVTSDTDYKNNNLELMEGITNIRQTGSLSGTVVQDNQFNVKGTFDTADIESGYYMRTIALYANDPDRGEILYAVVACDPADYIHSRGDVGDSIIHFDFAIKVAGAQNVTITIPTTGLITVHELNDIRDDIDNKFEGLEEETNNNFSSLSSDIDQRFQTKTNELNTSFTNLSNTLSTRIDNEVDELEDGFGVFKTATQSEINAFKTAAQADIDSKTAAMQSSVTSNINSMNSQMDMHTTNVTNLISEGEDLYGDMRDQSTQLDTKFTNKSSELDTKFSTLEDTYDERVTTLEGETSTLETLQAELTQTVQGGGRNLLLNSMKLTLDGASGAGITKSLDENGDLVVHLSSSSDFATNLGMRASNDNIHTHVEDGDYVTFSIDVKAVGYLTHPSFQFGSNQGSYSRLQGEIVEGEWCRLHATISWNGDADWIPAFYFNGTDSEHMLRRAKLEKGTIPTDYTRAPEDIQADIESVRQEAANATAAVDERVNILQSELTAAVQGGGRNLLSGTATEWVELHLSEGEWYFEKGTGYKLEVGETYTFSIEVEKVSDDTVPINLYLGVGDASGRNYLKELTGWRYSRIPFGQRISVTYTVQEGDFGENNYQYIAWRLRNEQRETTIRYRREMLQHGTIATAYTRAPEDIEADIEAVRLEAANATAAVDERVDTLSNLQAELKQALQGGGRNLAAISKTPHKRYQLRNNNGVTNPVVDEVYGDHRRTRKIYTGTTIYNNISTYSNEFFDAPEDGEKITKVLWVKPEEDVELRLETGTAPDILCPAGEWTKLYTHYIGGQGSATFNARLPSIMSDDIFSPDFTPWIEYKDPMVVKGWVVPDQFTRAPEDIQADIDFTQNIANQANTIIGSGFFSESGSTPSTTFPVTIEPTNEVQTFEIPLTTQWVAGKRYRIDLEGDFPYATKLKLHPANLEGGNEFNVISGSFQKYVVVTTLQNTESPKMVFTIDSTPDTTEEGEPEPNTRATRINSIKVVSLEGETLTQRSVRHQNEIKALESAVPTKLDKSAVTNTLTSTSTTNALSAAQGKALQDNKLDKSAVTNSLTSTSTTNALSAAQGKALADGKADKSQISSAGTANTVVQRDASGNINVGNNLTVSGSVSASTPMTHVYGQTLAGTLQLRTLANAKADLGITALEGSTVKRSDIVNTLTSTSTSAPLSAAQGKALQDGKLDKSDVHNTLTSSSVTQALSANQGRLLNNALNAKMNANATVDSLTSTSATLPLSAKQGKALQDTKVDKADVTHGITSDPTSNKVLSSYGAHQALSSKLDNMSIARNLNTDDDTMVLGAGQGKLLNDRKLDKSAVINNLQSESTVSALSAAQGKILYDTKIDFKDIVHGVTIDSPSNKVISAFGLYQELSFKLGFQDVAKNLTTNSDYMALSAKQGKILQDTKVNISDIVNSRDVLDEKKPLSALQGYLLDQMITNLTDTKVEVADIVNNLTTTTTNKPLSAAQGRLLNLNKLDKSDVTNSLTSTSTTNALSANQGRLLQNNKLDKSAVTNTLTSTSTTNALSAAQGKWLMDNKLDKAHAGRVDVWSMFVTELYTGAGNWSNRFAMLDRATNMLHLNFQIASISPNFNASGAVDLIKIDLPIWAKVSHYAPFIGLGQGQFILYGDDGVLRLHLTSGSPTVSLLRCSMTVALEQA